MLFQFPTREQFSIKSKSLKLDETKALFTRRKDNRGARVTLALAHFLHDEFTKQVRLPGPSARVTLPEC